MCINSMFFVYRCQSALVEGWMWARAENQKPNKSFWRMGPVQDGGYEWSGLLNEGKPSEPTTVMIQANFLEIHYRGNGQNLFLK